MADEVQLDEQQLAVLRALGACRQRLTARQTAEHAGVSEAQARRALNALRQAGFVQAIPMGRLDRPTVHVWWLRPAGSRLYRALPADEVPGGGGAAPGGGDEAHEAAGLVVDDGR